MRANDTDYNFKEVIFVPEAIAEELSARGCDISIVSEFRKLVTVLDKPSIAQIAQLNGAIDELYAGNNLNYKVSDFLPIKNNKIVSILNPDFWNGSYDLEKQFIAELLENHALHSNPNSFVKDMFIINGENNDINMDNLNENDSFHIYDRDGKFIYVTIKPKHFASLFTVLGNDSFAERNKQLMKELLSGVLNVLHNYHQPYIVAKSKWFRHYLSLLQ